MKVGGGGPKTYHERMRQRQLAGWENFMNGTKDLSGCYNVQTVHGYHTDRPPVSQRFQAWKEMRGEGELPGHVLILQDNQQWIIENEQRIKSEQILLQQQQQFQELSNLLGRSKAMNHDRRKSNRRESESETESDDTLDGKRRRHRHRRSKRRKDRRQQIRTDDEALSRESDSVSRSRSRSRSRNSRSRSRLRSTSRSRSRSRSSPSLHATRVTEQDNDRSKEEVTEGNDVETKGAPITNDDQVATETILGDGIKEDSQPMGDNVTDSEQEKSPSLDDGDDPLSEHSDEGMAEMPIPE